MELKVRYLFNPLTRYDTVWYPIEWALFEPEERSKLFSFNLTL